MRQRSVQMVQVNYRYGANVFAPYSVASLQAYAEAFPEIKESFRFQEPIFLREDPMKVVCDMTDPAVVGLSCYGWNWEYNKTLAKLVREAFPETLIVFGGPHVPEQSEGFFTDHPYVDLLVHDEGEIAFADVLRESLSANPDYTKISGLSVRVEGDTTHKTPSRGRIADLSVLPSPYLAGVLDFMLGRGYLLNVTQETNRGCPYGCKFCVWGQVNLSKVYLFPEDRILSEFDWFGRNKAEFIFSADANYGIKSRDMDLTLAMIKAKEKYNGYPNKFRMCTAKNSNDKIFQITRELNRAQMTKGATLSFQSMDQETLLIADRKNISIENFGKLMDDYAGEGIPTYSELIHSMPGETYQSTKEGIDTLLDASPDGLNLYVYSCTELPNASFREPAFIRQYGIKTVNIPIILAHSTPDPQSVPEFSETIVETSSMSKEDWRLAFLLYSVVQGFHCLGLTKHIAILFNRNFGVKYSDFYEKLVEYFIEKSDTLVGQEIATTYQIFAEAQRGGRLDRILPRFGDIYWPLEEATFLNLIADKERSYGEIRQFLDVLVSDLGLGGGGVDPVLLDDIVLYASSRIIGPHVSSLRVGLRYNLHEYLSKLRDPEVTLEKVSTFLTVKVGRDFDGDLETYAREIVWYGRKGGKFHHPVARE